MKRLALILALSLPLAAQAANVADWTYEESLLRRDQLREACMDTLPRNERGVCWIKIARDEADALRAAKDFMGLCELWEDKGPSCPSTRAYIRRRWGF